MWSLISSGQVHIRELLDLVGATAEGPIALQDAVRQVYDWHNGRSVTGLQLTFAPAAAAVLAVVAKPGSSTVVIGASVVGGVVLILGIVLLLSLNWLHGEYAYAVRLAVALKAFSSELALYPHGIGAPPTSATASLYAEIGSTSLVEYRRSRECREHVIRVLSKCLPASAIESA